MHYVHGDGSTYELGYGYVTGTITNTSGHALDNADVRLNVWNTSNDELAYAEAKDADDQDARLDACRERSGTSRKRLEIRWVVICRRPITSHSMT